MQLAIRLRTAFNYEFCFGTCACVVRSIIYTIFPIMFTSYYNFFDCVVYLVLLLCSVESATLNIFKLPLQEILQRSNKVSYGQLVVSARQGETLGLFVHSQNSLFPLFISQLLFPVTCLLII